MDALCGVASSARSWLSTCHSSAIRRAKRQPSSTVDEYCNRQRPTQSRSKVGQKKWFERFRVSLALEFPLSLTWDSRLNRCGRWVCEFREERRQKRRVWSSRQKHSKMPALSLSYSN